MSDIQQMKDKLDELRKQADEHREPRFRWHTVNYRERSRGKQARFNHGFWLHTPRLTPVCRLFGHRPVVDGVDMNYGPDTAANPRRSRWACCDRCGIRFAQPIDPDLVIGQRYTDPIPPAQEWPFGGEGRGGVFGGQIVLFGGFRGPSVEVKVGNPGSEHTLSGHLSLGRLGALYLHTERHGTWIQRRLNPVGYESRIIGFSAHHGRFRGQLWAKRDSWSLDDPRWQQWSFRIDPRDILLGQKCWRYTDRGDPVQGVVRMPHGDDYPVTLQLQHCSFGRDRGRRKPSWSVHWDVQGGIPTKNGDRGCIWGSGTTVSDASAEDGGWVEEACASIAARMTQDRIRHGYLYPQAEAS